MHGVPRRSPHGDGRRERRRRGLRTAHQVLDARSAPARAGAALCENRIAVAEPLLREHLKQHPTDVAAIRMLAEVAARSAAYADAENLLARCLELAPGFVPRDTTTRSCCIDSNKPAEALAANRRLLVERTAQPELPQPEGRACSRASASTTKPSTCTRGVLAEYPHQAQGLDELRPLAEDGGPPGRCHRRLPQAHRTRAAPRRGVLEPRESEDVSVLAGGRRGDAEHSSRAPT